MKLLLDENLSDEIIPKIIDLYPNSEHVTRFSNIQNYQFSWGDRS
ncbi:hypothetical protein [Scytonema sp. HK-05]|nr:hypothetical protein [Scytonema sp. HK-05]